MAGVATGFNVKGSFNPAWGNQVKLIPLVDAANCVDAPAQILISGPALTDSGLPAATTIPVVLIQLFASFIVNV